MSDLLAQLEERIGYAFRDRQLLLTALTHLSYAAEHPEAGESNQRLEFLGDAVLQILIGETLFDLFPQEREGALSKRRALLVNGTFLAQLAREIALDRVLRLGMSEQTTGGRNRTSSLGDAFEAMVGAIYRDSDLDSVRRVVLRLYGPLADRLATVEDLENPKGRLQELIQPRHGNNAVRYEVLSATGDDHAREYEVAVYVLDRRRGTGRGTSKKLAEEAAARAALTELRTTEP